MVWLRIIGIGLALLGLALSVNPALLRDPGPAEDLFKLIEQRIQGGMMLGVGVFLALRTTLRPLLETFAWLVLWFMVGALFARLLGLAVDGTNQKQWMLVLVELVLAACAAGVLWYRAGA
ncbi:MAG: DUF4345 family protein [Deltaproteobacteria bacterium]|nr:DUF4345 family protein [Deltaproteobacteria bacterium]